MANQNSYVIGAPVENGEAPTSDSHSFVWDEELEEMYQKLMESYRDAPETLESSTKVIMTDDEFERTLKELQEEWQDVPESASVTQTGESKDSFVNFFTKTFYIHFVNSKIILLLPKLVNSIISNATT